MDGGRALVLATVLLLAGAAGSVGVASGGADGPDSTIDRTISVSLTPGEPGSVAVHVAYDVPDRVSRLDVDLPDTAAVTATTGFERTAARTYDWTGETATPSVTFDFQVNETSTGGRATADGHQSGATGYDFVDVGPWALVRLPQVQSEWAWTGAESVGLDSDYRVAGEGTAGTQMAYLGRQTVHTRTAAGQTFSLVVPAAAELTASPDAVLSSLADASRALRVGDRDAEVNLFVAPTSVNWASAGLQYGDTDAWVRADARMDRARNTWLHEYVHTRQSFDTDRETAWVTEASAEYYAGLFALQQGRVGFEAFHELLDYGTNPVFARSVLSEPSTWVAGTQYFAGGLVIGNVDRRLRLATGGAATFQAVFAGMNAREEPVTGPAYEGLVREHGNDAVADDAVTWATTTVRPSAWREREHEVAFGTTPPTVDVDIDTTAFHVTGPYRNVTFDSVPQVYAGERLTLEVPVENVGDLGGTGTVWLTQNDTAVDAVTVDLAAGESTTVTLEAALDGPGTYALLVGTERVTVSVAAPATPQVAALAVDPSTVDPGDPVTVTATVRAPGDRPAGGTVEVLVGGEVRNATEVHLGPGVERTLTATVTLEEAGEHTVAVGNQTATVTVGGDAPSGDGGLGGTPGFGVLPALAAVAMAAALSRWR